MPAYARYLKEVLAKKRAIPDSLAELKTLSAPEHASTFGPKDATQKLDDPGKFTISVRLGKHTFEALCDLGASASLLPFAIWEEINMGLLNPVNMRLYMANKACVKATGMLENFPVQID